MILVFGEVLVEFSKVPSLVWYFERYVSLVAIKWVPGQEDFESMFNGFIESKTSNFVG